VSILLNQLETKYDKLFWTNIFDKCDSYRGTERVIHNNDQQLIHTGDVSEATLTPFGSVVIMVFPGATWSGNGAGSVTPGSGKSKGGTEEVDDPVSHPNRPPKADEDCFGETELELANRVVAGTLLQERA